MKKFLIAGLFILSTLFAPLSLAENGTKIGVINFQEVLQKSSEFEAVKTKLDKKFKPKQDKLVAAQKKLQEDVEGFRRNEAVMKPDDKKKAQEKIMKAQQELQAMEMGFQKEYMAERDKFFKQLFDMLKGKIETVAKKEGLDIVLTTEAVAYSKVTDITPKVADLLKKKK